MSAIYLDYNATTPVDPQVREAMLPYLGERFGNPSSSHRKGREAHEAVDEARQQVAAALGAEADEIIFTSGGTEANNLALKGVLLREFPPGQAHLVISVLEHPATVQPAHFLERLGYRVTTVPCNEHGTVEPEAVEAALRPETRLVSIMHANNEIGTIQPIAEIARRCRARGVLVHTDAAQSFGKIPATVQDLEVDLLSIAGHKMYAPKGVGALYARRGIELEPVLHGAGHERGLRAGTENVPYLVGLATAATLARQAVETYMPRVRQLRDRLEHGLEKQIPQLLVHGRGAERLPNTLSVNFPGVVGAELLAEIPDLYASTGSACHSGSVRMSATLKALGLQPDQARGTVRLSLGWHTTAEEIERSAELLVRAWRKVAKP